MLYYGNTSSFSSKLLFSVTKKYWAVKKEEIVNLTIFVLLSFL